MLERQRVKIATDRLKRFAASIGVDRVGWFTSCNFPRYLKTIKERKEYHNFRYRSYRRFLNAGRPRDRKKDVTTVIVILADYFYENDYQLNGLKISNYSRFCLQAVDPKTEMVVQFLKDSGYRAQELDVPGKVAACKAGLGFIGRNCLFYTPGLGSYVGIGTIGTDARFEVERQGEEQVVRSVCRRCNECVNACPTNAIHPGGYRINPFKCISFINRHPDEPHGEIPEVVSKLSNWLHGCEICQDVCPLNKKIKHKKNIVFSSEIELHGMKVPNVSTIPKEFLKKRLKDINSVRYREYVNTLLGNPL